MKTLEKKEKSKKNSRFELRWTKEEKILFERASDLAGHNSLANFITYVVKQRAEEIIEQNEKLLVSEKDREIFFDAIMNPAEPNKALIEAGSVYKDLLNE